MHLNPQCWEPNEKVNEEENKELVKEFSLEELKDTIFSMEKNTAPGPDHRPIEFYQSCWDIICNDLMDLFTNFRQNKMDIGRFNYGVITWLPKIKDAN